MPLYEYRCKDCGLEFSRIESINKKHNPPCDRCGREVEQIISPPMLQFKGSGFYVNDYKGK